ncbi:hypothetical protein J0677_25455, partial [Vibrio parahaemolyticus]|uniref:hypothetical protein n=1 Tax=Vibrio parahaemolyticus TaxID=670 RepID=UPI001A8D89B6
MVGHVMRGAGGAYEERAGPSALGSGGGGGCPRALRLLQRLQKRAPLVHGVVLIPQARGLLGPVVR